MSIPLWFQIVWGATTLALKINVRPFQYRKLGCPVHRDCTSLQPITSSGTSLWSRWKQGVGGEGEETLHFQLRRQACFLVSSSDNQNVRIMQENCVIGPLHVTVKNPLYLFRNWTGYICIPETILQSLGQLLSTQAITHFQSGLFLVLN